MKKTPDLSSAHVSDIVQMALSDHVSFDVIQREYGLSEPQVKELMRSNLKPGSYRAWRKRVRDFGDRRAHYK
ncbi:TIGR03643 family protein [Roseibium denhamense]|uniref:TIGR03643 family protein n=1 Tax=Roseibium denhamense TaxID=76305 RepID=A0ABY1NNS9_9HYPH|nr:TIGR03643 family protein [Roseibium denhamense]MTI07853.1 TIGR03643 family protein [Roseibium denhamense]SMP14445.1 TIGR03643 family protein [Roseibium denhamense]